LTQRGGEGRQPDAVGAWFRTFCRFVAYTPDMELPLRDPFSSSAIPPEKRQDAKVRRQMSGPAIRTFFNIADAWSISNETGRALLGWPPESTFFKYKAGQIGTLSFDMLIRISLVLGIYKDLHILYPEPSLADRWVSLPNGNPLFGGKPAIAFMTEAGMDGLYQVRRLLDSRRGGWN
jgi:hypothetical protein